MIMHLKALSCASMMMMLLFCLHRTNGSELRSFTNLLNGKRVDVFMILDESRPAVNNVALEMLKTTVNNLATKLNPSGSSPYFGVYFYGVTSGVDVRAAFPTVSAASVKSALDYKQYGVLSTVPSTLLSALNTVNSDCTTRCRADAPRATVIISSNLTPSVQATIQSMERSLGMTFLVVAVGNSQANSANANLLASYPQQYYAASTTDYYYLTILSDYISSTVSNVPRLVPARTTVSISSATYAYYTFQMNTADITRFDDQIVTIATNCQSCWVYVSLNRLLPDSSNAVSYSPRPISLNTNPFNYLSYFRVPRNTVRVFASVYGYPISPLVFSWDSVPIPTPLVASPLRVEQSDLSATLG